MIEDRLDRDERIRLEALNQAITNSMTTPMLSTELVLDKAVKFERYIREGTVRD
jgi:hypothetical protein